MRKPHIVLLMADQLRLDCLSCYSDLPVKTPNLDALSQEAIIFDHAYCAAPLCVPTRTTMYTGKYPHNHGSMVNSGHNPGNDPEKPYGFLGPEHRTLYESLDEGGYQITHVGVQHLYAEPGLQERVPDADIEYLEAWTEFAQSRGIPPSSYDFDHVKANSVPTPNQLGDYTVPFLFPTPNAHMAHPLPAEDYMDMFWARRMVERIEHMDFANPQYIEALFWAPHPPHVVPEPYYSMYPPEGIELPESVGRWYEGQAGTLLNQTCGHLGSTAQRDDYRGAWSAYFGFVTYVDACIGMVIDALKARGIWEDALVIFMQDHGEMLGNHWLWEKHCMYEEATHVPLLIKPPGGGTGRRKQVVGHVDFADTICDFAGAKRLAGSQGTSWRRLIDDPDALWREETFIEHNGDRGRGHQTRAIVAYIDDTLYKYIYNHGDKDELYNLRTDPHEAHSLIATSDYALVRKQLHDRLFQWMQDTEDYILSTPDSDHG
jgi:arylsulfatase A-like enzyme